MMDLFFFQGEGIIGKDHYKTYRETLLYFLSMYFSEALGSMPYSLRAFCILEFNLALVPEARGTFILHKILFVISF